MTKQLVCVECPKGCILMVEIKGKQVVSVKGNECPKGEKYAYLEASNPARVLTTTVVGKGLKMMMVPVKTDRPLPKDKLLETMIEIKHIFVDHPVFVGDIISHDICGLGVNLIATRDVS